MARNENHVLHIQKPQLKAGKFWLAAGIALLTVSGGSIANASADTTWQANNLATVQASLAKGENPYTIQWGDTLSVISEATGVSVSQLAQQNNIANVNLIYAGNQLFVHQNADGSKTVIVQNVGGQPIAQFTAPATAVNAAQSSSIASSTATTQSQAASGTATNANTATAQASTSTSTNVQAANNSKTSQSTTPVNGSQTNVNTGQTSATTPQQNRTTSQASRSSQSTTQPVQSSQSNKQTSQTNSTPTVDANHYIYTVSYVNEVGSKIIPDKTYVVKKGDQLPSFPTDVNGYTGTGGMAGGSGQTIVYIKAGLNDAQQAAARAQANRWMDQQMNASN